MRKCPKCLKDAHPTQTSAIRSAIRSSKRRGTPLRVYRAPCGHFALTKKPKIERGEAA